VSIDSRAVEKDDLFIAIDGPNFDGHDFVSDAMEAGAAAAMISRQPDGLPKTAPLLVVANTMDALRALAVSARTRTTARIIAITGSVGKTGTKLGCAVIPGEDADERSFRDIRGRHESCR
jgi:UDP-N-acetylmuramoyl-tripeptide--D-alanyl-D-alanine ligase